MALLQVNFLSQALFRNVTVNVVLPSDRLTENGFEDSGKPFKTLYLLHGLLGNYGDWVNNTRIQQWAEARRLAVVMPSGENSFYVDSPLSKHGEFIGQELLDITRRMFPLSDEREDTFICGLSMGGFGALRNGLKYYQNFGYIAGLSSAVHIFENPIDGPRGTIWEEDACFGDVRKAIETDMNPRVAFENLCKIVAKDPSVTFPKIYLACGTDDGLISANRVYRNMFEKAGVDLTYEEGPGEHNWDFWNKYILRVLHWLPLDKPADGISSGNVKRINE